MQTKSFYRIIVIIFVAGFMLPLQSIGQQKIDTIKLFFLGGQSNMVGLGKNAELPKDLSSEIDSVYIFHGNTAKDGKKNGGIGLWQILKAGHGRLFRSTEQENELSESFGPELSFGKTLKLLYPNEKIAIIKYAKGGSSLDRKSWLSMHMGTWDHEAKRKRGINQYTHFLRSVSQALAIKDIDKDGRLDYLEPSGIVWMQGETDAFHNKPAQRYKNNLTELMQLIRVAFHNNAMPIVIGKISDSGQHRRGKVWKHGEVVMQAQEEFVAEDKNAILVESTSNYNYIDKYHYDSAGYIDLGKQFANAIYKLLNH